MVRYIKFESEDGTDILVEVESGDLPSQSGLQKTGLRDVGKAGVAVAQATFEASLEAAVRVNARSLLQAVSSLPEKPSEVEFSFGLKATAEVGNIAICKAGGEATYSVKLVWKQQKLEQSVENKA